MGQAVSDLTRQIAFQLAAFCVAMVGFWLVQGRDLATRAEVSDMIAKEAPYMQDRAMVLATLNDSRQMSHEFRKSVDANTQAIIELQAVLEHITRNMK